jgi:hypothetical protein
MDHFEGKDILALRKNERRGRKREGQEGLSMAVDWKD